MQCTNCGLTVTPGAVDCPRCGSHLSKTGQGEEVEYKEYSSSTRANPPPADGVTPRQYPHVTPISTATATGSTLPTSSQQHQPYTPAPIQKTTRPRRYSPLSIALLVILLILLVISGSGLIYYAAVTNPAELRSQATAVARTVLTAQAQATAHVFAQATATTAALTPDQLYTRATSGTPVINDPLNSAATGIMFKSKTDPRCAYINGAYHIRPSLANGSTFCPSYGTFFTNLAFQVQMTIFAQGAGGPIFNTQPNGTSAILYSFVIDPTGRYSLTLGKANGFTDLLSGTNTAIHTGLDQSNLLTVVAFDGQIYIYTNKQLLGHVTNHASTVGQPGLMAENPTSGTTDIAFTNMQVWSL
jgi:hypothetical protein